VRVAKKDRKTPGRDREIDKGKEIERERKRDMYRTYAKKRHRNKETKSNTKKTRTRKERKANVSAGLCG
jgi:hypothetical protein